MSEIAAPIKSAEEKYCIECGAIIRAKAELCPKCGVRQPMLASSNNTLAGFGNAPGTSKSRLVAALLAILLGGIGIHKFYLGQSSSGLLFLLFCWTGIPFIIGLIQGIQLLGMNDTDFAVKYPG